MSFLGGGEGVQAGLGGGVAAGLGFALVRLQPGAREALGWWRARRRHPALGTSLDERWPARAGARLERGLVSQSPGDKAMFPP